MSAQASDNNFIAFNISSQDKFQKNQNVQSLSEVLPIGKIWDKHIANTDKVLHYYAKADEHYFQQYAWRMRICSELLKFQLVPDESEGIFKLKLADARFCRVRHCPVCQWRRRRRAACRQTSLTSKARAYKILPQVVTDYPKYRWLVINHEIIHIFLATNLRLTNSAAKCIAAFILVASAIPLPAISNAVP